MSVDVSPDGNQLVIDLLGDIYLLPAEGGKAERVHGGTAMHRMPTFSPDGRKIAYISDASGRDSIWVSDMDGGGAHCISGESEGTFTTPAWTASGEQVAATWFSDAYARTQSSEIRRFTVAGGDGEVVVSAAENGRDVGEVTFSPDGRYAFFTHKTATPGIFVDANHPIHVIKRRDLQTGEIIDVVGGYGGAVAPQVSPDGRSLAFVRRVKEKTVLFVVDLETGEQRPVYDGLDRDGQANFLPQGTYYPAYSWFPDNGSVVIWAKGGLLRVDILSGTTRKIPFEVEVRQRVADVPLLQNDLFTPRVLVRAISNPSFSPDGRDLLFSALGKLWRKRLPDGETTPLTGNTELAFEPAYAPDGRRVAYVAWDDERGAALKVLSLDNGQSTTLLEGVGVIREPVFSASGSEVAFRIQPGTPALGGFSGQPGIYWLSLSNGKRQRLSEAGESPRFSPDGERIYFHYLANTGGGAHYDGQAGERVLASVDVRGGDQHIHAVGAEIEAMGISPDLRWLFFRHHRRFHMVPLKQDAGVQLVSTAGLDGSGLHHDGVVGHDFAWAPDSRRIAWLMGDEVHTASLQMDSTGDSWQRESTARIGIEVPADVPEGRIAFINGRIITMRGEEVIERGTIVVSGNMIEAIGSSAHTDVPSDALLVDVVGKTLMPGFVDMHGHIGCCGEGGPIPRKQPSLYAALAFGVTTNFDPYSSEMTGYLSAEMLQAGATVGPRSVITGRAFYGRMGTPDFSYLPVAKYGDALSALQTRRAMGGFAAKSYKLPGRDQRQMFVEAGRDTGVLVAGEGEGHFYNGVSMILDGYTTLEHNLPVATYYNDVIQLMAQSGTAHTPTLIVAFGEIMGENYFYQKTRAWEEPRIRTFVQSVNSGYSALNMPRRAPPHVRGMITLSVADELWDIGVRSLARSMKRLDEAGVIINAGSHGQIPGLGMHWEMWLLAEGGMDNHRVLRTATTNGAATLGVAHQLGTLEPGKLADIIVLDGNPLIDIRNTLTVSQTMVNGHLYDAHSLDEVGNRPRKRGKFYWEVSDTGDVDWSPAWYQ